MSYVAFLLCSPTWPQSKTMCSVAWSTRSALSSHSPTPLATAATSAGTTSWRNVASHDPLGSAALPRVVLESACQAIHGKSRLAVPHMPGAHAARSCLVRECSCASSWPSQICIRLSVSRAEESATAPEILCASIFESACWLAPSPVLPADGVVPPITHLPPRLPTSTQVPASDVSAHCAPCSVRSETLLVISAVHARFFLSSLSLSPSTGWPVAEACECTDRFNTCKVSRGKYVGHTREQTKWLTAEKNRSCGRSKLPPRDLAPP